MINAAVILAALVLAIRLVFKKRLGWLDLVLVLFLVAITVYGALTAPPAPDWMP